MAQAGPLAGTARVRSVQIRVSLAAETYHGGDLRREQEGSKGCQALEGDTLHVEAAMEVS